MNGQIPYVIDRVDQVERTYDIYSRLLEDRIVFLGRPISDEVANVIIAQLLFLEAKDREKDIYLYINTPGGSVTGGLAINDTLRYVKSPVRTICVGLAASMGALLLAAGTPGKRFALPNSKILIHQPWGGMEGTAIDLNIHAREIMRTREQVNSLLSEYTGQPRDRIEKDTDRDFFMNSQEAKDYGLIDELINSRK
ncbi:MAG: ATP-dependent Clp protease proteolytic subunit [Candidatus Bipolaricaulota bacterium]